MRRIVKFLVVGIVVLVSIQFLMSTLAMASFDWKKYEGTTIRVIHVQNWYGEAVENWIPEFEALTGVKVQLEIYAFGSLYEKLMTEMMTGMTDLDVYISQPYAIGLQFDNAGWYEPLQKYVDNPELTSPLFNLLSFFSSAINTGCSVRGKLIGLPWIVSTALLYYNEALFEQYGVAVPGTFAELEAAAKKLTVDTNGDGKIDIYGITMRGKQALPSFQPWLLGFGGDFLDEEGKPAINSPEAVEALKAYARVLRQYGPPGTPGYSISEIRNVFSQRMAAMMMGDAGHGFILSDPEKSKVSKEWRASVVPAGAAGSLPFVDSTWNYNMYSGSDNKEASWLFLQWVTNPHFWNELIRGGASVPMETSWKDPIFLKTVEPTWLAAVNESFRIGRGSYVPPVVRGNEARGIIEAAITQALEGGDVKKLLDRAAQEMQEIM